MKKTLLLFIFAALSGMLSAQSSIKPPEPVKHKFDSLFPGAKDVKWVKSGVDYEADFMMDVKHMKAKFAKNGVYIEKQLAIQQATLPSPAKEYILSKCSGQSVKDVYKVTKAGGGVTYVANVGGKILKFDSGGKLMSSGAATKPKTSGK